ncbi:MAG TPA: hypothetical protein GX714_12635 [Chloroflexi bacterium]|nr:hypothetical protein [Chloroflexota bacterium]
MAGNLASVHGEAERAEALWSRVDGNCQRIVPVGEGVTELRPTWFSGPAVERLDAGSLFFRRNARVWQALFVTEPGEYRLTVRGQCKGPEPALMRVRVHASDDLLEFGSDPTERSETISLVPGLNVLIADFVNDSVSELGDRNLEILEIRVERLSS